MWDCGKSLYHHYNLHINVIPKRLYKIRLNFSSHENSPIAEAGFYPGTRATAYDKFSECYTEIPVMIDLRGKSFTIAAWIKIKAKSQMTQTIISDWADPQQFTFSLSSSQRLLFKRYYKDGTPNQILSSKVVSIGRWYHVAVTFDKESGLVRLYLDTIEIESLVFDMKEWRGPSSKPIIGDSLSTAFPDQKFSGAIMDVYVFGVVKSGGELDDLRGESPTPVYLFGVVKSGGELDDLRGESPTPVYVFGVVKSRGELDDLRGESPTPVYLFGVVKSGGELDDLRGESPTPVYLFGVVKSGGELDDLRGESPTTVYVFGVVKSRGELDDLRAPLDERMVFQHLPGSLTGHVISSHTEFDHRLCMVLCARTSACVSFNHRPDGGICQLKNGTKREYPGDFITSNGFQYYEKLEFTLIPWK
ncbi:predicted protein [Nematostella vectensis]|uniref:Uncharacterized protein n=1 Tax=Nematostella vectensis TaxID=45351 RepID=A7RU88_NEMVE|nr:predicted protein [Nematostella vectensis]|eukprot:XP_001637101.1 predicted protein [Nematostella vectensis]